MFDLKKYLAEGRLFENDGTIIPSSFVALKSIGTWLDTDKGIFYAMTKDGGYDPDSDIFIMDADHYEIMDYISDEDKEIYYSIMDKFQKK